MELTPLCEATGSFIRKIRRMPTRENELHDQVPRTIPGDNAINQPNEDPSSSSIITQEASDSNNGPRTLLEESVPRVSFGPLYVVDHPSMIATKEKAWELVLNNSSETDPLVTTETYTGAISQVQTEAKETYAEELSITDSNFRWMMIKDGCLFLQLALSILGVTPDKLGYTSNDPIFGVREIKKDAKMWIESMFFMGNQIPLVVLKELMSQKFFQDVIKRVKWEPSPSTLCKKVLYELLVLPAVKKRSLITRLTGRDNSFELNQSCDLLHGLENLVIGTERPGYLNNEYEAVDDLDLEANDEEEINICEGSVAGENGDRLRVLLNAIGLIPGDIADQTRIFPSATDLNLAGIHIKKLKGGVRRIHFKISLYFWANLYLPPFLVDDHTEIIFKNLKMYEISQQVGKQKHQICSYLTLMSGIIQTTKDVKLLENAGIIKGSPIVKEKLPRIFSRLTSDVKTLTREFRTLREQIRDYSSPMVRYRGIINVVVFLTLLQAVFAVLAYFRPPKN